MESWFRVFLMSRTGNNYELRGIRKKFFVGLIGYQVLARQGSVEIRIYSAHQNTCFWVFLFPQIDWGQMSKCHLRPFFSKKVLQRNLAKFRVKYEINPLSNLNLAWEICEAFFLLTFFFTYSYSAFGLSLLITQLSAKWNNPQRPQIQIQNLIW